MHIFSSIENAKQQAQLLSLANNDEWQMVNGKWETPARNDHGLLIVEDDLD